MVSAGTVANGSERKRFYPTLREDRLTSEKPSENCMQMERFCAQGREQRETHIDIQWSELKIVSVPHFECTAISLLISSTFSFPISTCFPISRFLNAHPFSLPLSLLNPSVQGNPDASEREYENQFLREENTNTRTFYSKSTRVREF